MFDIKERPKMVERAYLLGVYHRKDEEANASSLLDELESLVDTLGVPVIGKALVRAPQLNPKLVTGTGKAEEICTAIQALNADVLIFDNTLTPAQQRNWEQLTNITVIDREEIIIDIFASRAQTKEARLQVDLARLEYSMPRLKRAWTHLDRQGGGVGAKGEGERQIETDRRLLRKQIDRLKAEIGKVRSNRATQRKLRERIPIPRAAIVGYTNAGKSSLLRLLTDANVLVEDKLFATLDTTTRKIILPNNQKLLLTDTVGFVRNLPHHLIDAFKATLEEATSADFLIHVIDGSSPMAETFHQTTLDVLSELDALNKNILTVFNKIDLIEDPAQLAVLRNRFPDALFISVAEKKGISDLLEAVTSLVSRSINALDLLLPLDRTDIVATLHEHGKVSSINYEDDGIPIHATSPPKVLPQWQPFITH